MFIIYLVTAEEVRPTEQTLEIGPVRAKKLPNLTQGEVIQMLKHVHEITHFESQNHKFCMWKIWANLFAFSWNSICDAAFTKSGCNKFCQR